MQFPQRMTELNPGRELDALVAEKVMGWKPYMFPNPIHGFGQPSELLMDAESAIELDLIPRYSTDIAAAWKVVEKVKLNIITRYQDKWLCTNVGSDFQFWCEYPNRYENLNDDSYCELGDTAPHAICLAALRAVGK